MHPALKVPEILFLIFKRDLSGHDLVNCALVCRLWGIWAPDVLWRTCCVPLQAALGPITKTSKKCEGQDAPCVEIGNIDASAWKRFLALSSKITRIIVDCALSDASVDRIELAKQKFHGEPFAQPRTLEMGMNDGHHKTISLLAVPCLTSEICPSMDGDSLAWITNTLPVVAPNIVRVKVGATWNPDCSLDFSRYSALKHLELRINCMEPQLWEGLSSCQLLAKVELSVCLDVADRDDFKGRGWSVDHVHLPALREFKFRYVNREAMRKLIFRSRMPMLECLWWDIRSKPDNRTLDEMAAQLKLYSPKLDIDMLYHMNI